MSEYKSVWYIGPLWFCTPKSGAYLDTSNSYKKRIASESRKVMIDGDDHPLLKNLHDALVFPSNDEAGAVRHIYVASEWSPWALYFNTGVYLISDPAEGDLRHRILSYFEEETRYLKTYYSHVEYTWKIVEWYKEI